MRIALCLIQSAVSALNIEHWLFIVNVQCIASIACIACIATIATIAMLT